MWPMLAHSLDQRIRYSQQQTRLGWTRIDERPVIGVVYCEEWADVTDQRNLPKVIVKGE